MVTWICVRQSHWCTSHCGMQCGTIADRVLNKQSAIQSMINLIKHHPVLNFCSGICFILFSSLLNHEQICHQVLSCLFSLYSCHQLLLSPRLHIILFLACIHTLNTLWCGLDYLCSPPLHLFLSKCSFWYGSKLSVTRLDLIAVLSLVFNVSLWPKEFTRSRTVSAE